LFELFAICNQLGVLQKDLHVSPILNVQNLHIYFDKNMQNVHNRSREEVQNYD